MLSCCSSTSSWCWCCTLRRPASFVPLSVCLHSRYSPKSSPFHTRNGHCPLPNATCSLPLPLNCLSPQVLCWESFPKHWHPDYAQCAQKWHCKAPLSLQIALAPKCPVFTINVCPDARVWLQKPAPKPHYFIPYSSPKPSVFTPNFRFISLLFHPKFSSQNLLISSQIPAPNPYYFPPNSSPKPSLFHAKNQPQHFLISPPQQCSSITPSTLLLNLTSLSSQHHPPASTQCQSHSPMSTFHVTPTLSTQHHSFMLNPSGTPKSPPAMSPQCHSLMSTLLISQHHTPTSLEHNHMLSGVTPAASSPPSISAMSPQCHSGVPTPASPQSHPASLPHVTAQVIPQHHFSVSPQCHSPASPQQCHPCVTP